MHEGRAGLQQPAARRRPRLEKLLRQAQAAVIQEAILREASHFGPRLAGGEAREAIAAILEKRPPDFSKFE